TLLYHLEFLTQMATKFSVSFADFLRNGLPCRGEQFGGLLLRLLKNLRAQIAPEANPQLLFDLRRNVGEGDFELASARSAVGELFAQARDLGMQGLNQFGDEGLHLVVRRRG